MRLIGSVYTPEAVLSIVQMLNNHHIAHTIETHTVTDWGSHTYGDKSWVVWVTNEEDLPTAQALYEGLLQQYDPLTPPTSLQSLLPPKPGATLPLPSHVAISQETPPHQEHDQEMEYVMDAEARQPPLKIITILLLFICLFCFGASYLLTNPSNRGELFATPLIPTDPVKQALLYDFPPYYQLVNELIQSKLDKTKEISETDLEPYYKQLSQQFESRPVWQGYYTIALAWLKNEPWKELLAAPRFEKIRQGEIWRLFTPIFLHQNLLHLLFNLLWVYLLGRQLESGLGTFRYLLFCLVVAAVSNTAQYLVSGPNFLGISGLVCGMVTYIWVRLRQTKHLMDPVDYFLTPGTFQGLSLFVGALFILQIFSFFLEATTHTSIPVGVANTAHVTGALCGALLALFTTPSKRTL